MEREILFKYAQNCDGKIIHINNAVEGVDYYCPECSTEFIFKHGKIRQKHFAHKNPSPDCTNEGYLHNTFKKYLLQRIQEKISTGNTFFVSFKCNICSSTHKGNLLNGVNRVADEFVLDGCRPDIVLFDSKNQIPIIIEIVDTHEPEQNVMDYCTKNHAILIIIRLESINDLESIEGKIENPSTVLLTNQLMCPTFKKQLSLQRPNILIPNIRMNRGGPKIDQIEAAQERKKYIRQRNYYKNRRHGKR